MCGIALTWASHERCRSMLEKMEHRGLSPHEDYSRTISFLHSPVLGHVRLPIIDLSEKQNQPISDNKIAMVFNGEIYNYREIDPKAKSDTTLLLQLLSKHGPSILNYVDGMYSIIYYNFEDKTTHILTDHLCKKPLYMNLRTKEVASELKALGPFNEFEINHKFLGSVAYFGYDPCGQTIFKDIVQIGPNVHITIDRYREIVDWESYLDLSPLPYSKASLEVQLTYAVYRRLESDVPISFLLSGGLDSSIVTTIATHRINPARMKIFHIANQEEQYVDIMSDYLGIGTTTKLTLPDVDDLVEQEALYYNESPVDLGSVVPQYLLCQTVHNHNYKVVITGDGADELFGGYTRMSELRSIPLDTQYHDVFSELPYYHCPRLDKMSMAHTVELRSPFLSKDLIRTSLSIPYPERIKKLSLKQMAKGHIPDEIIERKKEPLRVNSMREDREKFRARRIQQFMSLLEQGVYND